MTLLLTGKALLLLVAPKVILGLLFQLDSRALHFVSLLQHLFKYYYIT